MLACLRLLEQLPEPGRGEVLAKLRRAAAVSVARGRSEWAHYSLQPLMVASSPDSPLYSGLQAEVDANLDYVIESQDRPKARMRPTSESEDGPRGARWR